MIYGDRQTVTHWGMTDKTDPRVICLIESIENRGRPKKDRKKEMTGPIFYLSLRFIYVAFQGGEREREREERERERER